MTFLHQVAETLKNHYGDDLHRVLVLLPSRRADQFLRKALVDVYQKPLLAPGIASVEQFVAAASRLQILPPLDLLLHFFDHYTEKLGAEAESFQSFMKWAPMMLKDFMEIDRHMAAGEKIYEYFHDLERIKYWSPDAPERLDSPLIQKFIKFAEDAGAHYQTFTAYLMRNKWAHQGLAYRTLAENPEQRLLPYLKKMGFDVVVAAGLNALNTSEEHIFEWLRQNFQFQFLWDADNYYLKDDLQEAGAFLRKWQYKWHGKSNPMTFVGNTFATQNKKIHLIPVSGITEQARAAGKILSELPPEALQTEKTALVLADENLLIPVLNALPEQVESFNITMGYPLQLHPYSQAVVKLLRLHEVAHQYQANRGKYAFYHKQLFELLQHTLLLHAGRMQQSLENPFQIEALRRRNIVYYTPENMAEIIGTSKAFARISSLFAEHTTASLLEKLVAILATFDDLPELPATEKEVAYQIKTIAQRLCDLITTRPYLADFKTISLLLNDFLSTATVDFFGEPTRGLQIMGVLETRVLDFDHVILTSVNEGVLPSGRTDFSMLPYEVKKAFGLPSFLEKDAVYAYHFYRLLQRAKTITLIYSTEDSGMGKGAPSRFVLQIQQELKTFPNIQIERRPYLPEVDFDQLRQPYQPEVDAAYRAAIQAKAERGFSPSALARYLADPLGFYKSDLLGIQEAQEVEEEIFNQTLGNALHLALEKFYQPFVGSYPLMEDYKKLHVQAGSRLRAAFQEVYKNGHLDAGANLMIFKVGEQMLAGYAQKRMAAPEKNRTIVAVERNLEAQLWLPKHQMQVKIHGIADRIDQIAEGLQVLDYKTGRFADADVRFTAFEDLMDGEKGKGKALQLMIYIWLLYKNHPEHKAFMGGIIPLTRYGGVMAGLSKSKSDVFDTAAVQEFEQELVGLIERMMAGGFGFAQPPAEF